MIDLKKESQRIDKEIEELKVLVENPLGHENEIRERLAKVIDDICTLRHERLKNITNKVEKQINYFFDIQLALIDAKKPSNPYIQ